MTKKQVESDTATGVAIFWKRLRVTMSILSEGFFLVGALVLICWQSGAFPVLGDYIEGRLLAAQREKEISLNTQFRIEWPRGEWNNGEGLPMDEVQNKNIIKLGKGFTIIDRYIRLDCQHNRDKGEKHYDCTNLSTSIELETID